MADSTGRLATVRRILAVLIAARGVMNCLKRFGAGSGFVFLGQLLPPDTVLAPLFGIAMIAYGYGLWTGAAWAVPLGVVYAIFATANLLLFPVRSVMPPAVAPWMYAIYVVGGIVLSWGSVWLLRRARSGG